MKSITDEPSLSLSGQNALNARAHGLFFKRREGSIREPMLGLGADRDSAGKVIISDAVGGTTHERQRARNSARQNH